MNHTLDNIQPFKNMREEVRSGDVITIYFPHTKITGHIRDNAPWSASYESARFDEDDFLLSLHSNEGSSEDMPFNLPCYGINCSEGTLTQKVKDYHHNAGELIKIKAKGYSIIQRQWDYQIDGFIPGKVHCGFGIGTYPLNGETDETHHKIKGVLMNDRKNYGPSAGIIMYADSEGKYIDKALILLSPLNETKLAREYQAKEMFLYADKKTYLEADNKNPSEQKPEEQTKIKFSGKSLENILSKKINTVMDKKIHIVNIIQL
jgi:hypothetical protein